MHIIKAQRIRMACARATWGSEKEEGTHGTGEIARILASSS